MKASDMSNFFPDGTNPNKEMMQRANKTKRPKQKINRSDSPMEPN